MVPLWGMKADEKYNAHWPTRSGYLRKARQNEHNIRDAQKTGRR